MDIKSLISSDKELAWWFKYGFKRWRATKDYNVEDVSTMVDILKHNFEFTDEVVLSFARADHTINHMYF